jgi:hypothetical protein
MEEAARLIAKFQPSYPPILPECGLLTGAVLDLDRVRGEHTEQEAPNRAAMSEQAERLMAIVESLAAMVGVSRIGRFTDPRE